MNNFIQEPSSDSVFYVSFAHSDRVKASAIINCLESEGFSVWHYEDTVPGTEWLAAVKSHLESCSLFLALVSSDYPQSGYCMKEIQYAISLKKPVLCIYLDDHLVTDQGLQLRISHLRSVKYSEKDAFSFRYELLTAVQSLLRSAKTSPPDSAPQPLARPTAAPTSAHRGSRPAGKRKHIRIPFRNTLSILDSAPPKNRSFCPECGKRLNADAQICPNCKKRIQAESCELKMQRVQFSGVAPRTFTRGGYSIIHVVMYEEFRRHIVDELIRSQAEPVQEEKAGVQNVREESTVKVVLQSPDISIEDDTETRIWQGEYLDFSFTVFLPKNYRKKQVLFTARVYINDVIATRISFVVNRVSVFKRKLSVSREDVLSAFVSYASQDRENAARVVQGIKKGQPEMNVFFDVESLRSGENWEEKLYSEIANCDIFYLCWSHFARESPWVNREWKYALQQKGIQCIEPVPLEKPDRCPPPQELSQLHFNDRLLYIIDA